MPRYAEQYKKLFGDRKPLRNAFNDIIGFYENEEFKPLKQYNCIVSNYGTVIGCKRRFRPFKTKKLLFGYKVTLQNNETNKTDNVCLLKLVGLAFVPNPNNYNFVEPINLDWTDTRATNIRWIEKENENLVRERKRKRYFWMMTH